MKWRAEAQAGIKTARRNINNLRYADDTTLMAESEELTSLLMKVKEKSEKSGLKLNVQKTKTMASGPITSWQIDGETIETVTDLFSWAPKSLQMVTATMKLKDTRSWTKAMTNLDSVLKSTDNTLPTKFHRVENSDKMWPIGEGNGNPLKYSCIENPMKSIKGKKIGHWKMNSPGW